MCELISQQVGLHVSLWVKIKPQIPHEDYKTSSVITEAALLSLLTPFPHTFYFFFSFFLLFKQGQQQDLLQQGAHTLVPMLPGVW